ncbi:N1R/p28-like protein [Choristoneura biennis entomopoxvirus]|uniref:N1R/p28-like protein n=1 Tax=Choristoneura biennis entomopoxvirus TaxID=10288 RepID=A0A916KPN2_CBEPV|nr:N1R/p28-like protein [Choristoneura biennis entomopoxvirus]CCU55687.1 N1R/p28-like protein [Choristoneura biennis entomopoxvirus]
MKTYFYEVKNSNNHHISKLITGQYVPKEIILDIASWISIEFYMKCNDIIISYYKNEFKSLSDEDIENEIKKIDDKYKNIIEEKDIQINSKDIKIDELNEKLDSIIESNKNLENQNNKILETNKNLENQNNQLLKLAQKQNIKLDEIGDELEETNYKLDTLTETVEEVILPDRNISPSDINLKHNLVIYKINNAIKIIRAQNKYINKNNIPDNDIIIEYVPNPIDFINRMKLYCNETNKKFKKDLKKNNKSMSNEDFIELYDSTKRMEIKYNNVFLNNSKMDHVIELFNKLKEEQYDY